MTMDKSSKQKIDMEMQILNETLEQMFLIDILRTFYPKAEEYTFFSNAYETFYKILYLESQITLIKFIFSDHKAMRLGINYREKKKTGKHKHMELKQYISKL